MIPARHVPRRVVPTTRAVKTSRVQQRAVATSRVTRRALLDDPEVRKVVTSAKRFSTAKGFSIKEANESWEDVAKRLTAKDAVTAADNEMDQETINKLEQILQSESQAGKGDAAAAADKLAKLGLNPEPAGDINSDGSLGAETEYLYKVAILNKWDLNRLRSDLAHFADQCKTNPAWGEFYLQPSPLWDEAEYKRSIDEHWAKLPYDKPAKYFLNYLKQTNTLKSAPMIAERFSQSLLRASNEFTVTISTGKPLTDVEMQHHAELVAKQVAAQAQGPPPTIHLINNVDQAISGGFRLSGEGANISADKVWDKKKLNEAIKEITDKYVGKSWRDELKAALNH